MKIVRISATGSEIDCKRLYLPFVLRDTCKCGAEILNGYDDDYYLSYPKLGVPITIHFYCEACRAEWDRKVVLDVSLTEAP